MYDLPSEHIEEETLPDQFHALEAMLLVLTFMPPNWSRNLVLSAMDLCLYYDAENPQWYKRPDWFGAVGVPSLYQGSDLRMSYVMWQEQVSPFVIVEFLSASTEKEDLGQTKREPEKPPTKWEVYEQILQVPYYVVFGRRDRKQFQAFRLEGDRYQSVDVSSGSLVLPEIQLSLGLWQGSFQGVDRLWLRWMTLDGNLILTPEEENDRLKARLRELGVDPNELS